MNRRIVAWLSLPGGTGLSDGHCYLGTICAMFCLTSTCYDISAHAVFARCGLLNRYVSTDSMYETRATQFLRHTIWSPCHTALSRSNKSNVSIARTFHSLTTCLINHNRSLRAVTRNATLSNLCKSRQSLLEHAYTQRGQQFSSNMSLTRSTDPLVWIDCEMTGLDPTKDIILSISCYITDHVLSPVDPKGYHAVISTPSSILSNMNDWCIKTHTATGLVDACQSSSAIPASQAATGLLEYIKQHVPKERTALLAGNSVHADKMFLMKKPWSPVLGWLHYRILDVSAIKEAVRRWGNDDVLEGVPRKKLTHSADEDIKESLEEARYYMELFGNMQPSNKVTDR